MSKQYDDNVHPDWRTGTGETCIFSIGQKCHRHPPVMCADGIALYPFPTHGTNWDDLCPCAAWRPKE